MTSSTLSVVGAGLILHARDVPHYIPLPSYQIELQNDDPMWVFQLHGELAMRAIGPSSWASEPIDLSVSGAVDGAGTARVRQLSHSCSYDFVWQKGTR